MSGGGSRSLFSKERTPANVAKRLLQSQDQVASAEFKTSVSQLHNDLLAGFNQRDSERIQEHLRSVKEHLGSEVSGTVDFLFGGSVAKHTYVDGLSDVDSLMEISNTELAKLSSTEALDRVTEILRKRMGDEAQVTHGALAVTLAFPDGLSIQLLPAFKTDDGLKIPSAQTAGQWSEINPQTFQQALTSRNQDCGNKLVPTVKLAKAIIGTLPESKRLSGYHVESLAIAAFRNYEGDRSTSAMLPHFFETAKQLVLEPIRDRTGQSIHVDGYLGPAGSQARQEASHLLERMAKRIRIANLYGSIPQWKDLFGLES